VITTFMIKIALVSISMTNNQKFATLMIILCTILISMMTTVMLTTGASENMIRLLVNLYLQMVGLNMKQCKSSQLFTGAQCTYFGVLLASGSFLGAHATGWQITITSTVRSWELTGKTDGNLLSLWVVPISMFLLLLFLEVS